MGDRREFEMAAGASVHYIDDGIDTGPVISAVRFQDLPVDVCTGRETSPSNQANNDKILTLAREEDSTCPIRVFVVHMSASQRRDQDFLLIWVQNGAQELKTSSPKICKSCLGGSP